MEYIIKNWLTGNAIATVESETWRSALEKLIEQKANLRYASLSGANLSGASLSDADLSDADLSDADLSGADLSDADLSDADLSLADLSLANLRGANLRGEIVIPTIPDLDKAILGAIEGGGHLRMDHWHTCETTHCRAGWAITLAGDKGAALEAEIGSCAAGALIYHTSAGYVPDFCASDSDALEDIRVRAAAAERSA